VRQKLQQKVRKPLTSYEHDEETEPQPPDNEGESSEEEESAAKEVQEKGLEFISEFPPPEPSPPPPTQEKKTSFERVTQDKEAATQKPAAVPSEKKEVPKVEQLLPENRSLKQPLGKPEQPLPAREQLPQTTDAPSNISQPATRAIPSPIDETQSSLGESAQGEEGRVVPLTSPLTSPLPQQLPTGEIVFSRDPRVAKRQRQLLDQSVLVRVHLVFTGFLFSFRKYRGGGGSNNLCMIACILKSGSSKGGKYI